MDKLIEQYKDKLRNDDNGGYGYPIQLKNKIEKELDSNSFEIHVKIVQEMLETARNEGVL